MTFNKLGISVVICTYNGRERLRPTLEAILRQKLHQSNFELIVVDNASQDKSLEFCEQFLTTASAAFSWKTVQESKSGLNHARLKGLREAQSEVVLFCDDDNELAENYLQIAFDLLQNNPLIGALGGCGIPSFEGTKPDWFDTYSHSFAVGPQSKMSGKLLKYPAELYGAGTFFRKSPLLRFFDQDFDTITSDRKGNSLTSGGDVEWCYLVQLAGYEIWYDHQLTFLHLMPDSRMQWNYYVRLKEGIASSTGRLLPYTCLFKDRSMGVFTYFLCGCSKTLLASLVYFKHKALRALPTSTNNPDNDLAVLVLRANMRSYYKNAFSAFHHFRQLKTML